VSGLLALKLYSSGCLRAAFERSKRIFLQPARGYNALYAVTQLDTETKNRFAKLAIFRNSFTGLISPR
jgi:hypothetical protein